MDFAVVGGGIIGCLTARELVRREPQAEIVLLERESIGGGASRLSAGTHIPRGTTAGIRQMTAHSQNFYRELHHARPAWPIRPIDLVVLSRQSPTDLYTETLRPRQHVPALVQIPAGMDVWQVAQAHHADVHALTQLIAADVRRAGVHVREGVGVTAIEPAGQVGLELTTGERIEAGRVVLATGPWLAGSLPARVKKIVAMHVEVVPSELDPLVLLHDDNAFLLPLPHRGHWLFSYTCDEWDVHPDEIERTLGAADIAEARTVLGGYAPALADRCTSGRVFCDAYTSSGEPVVETSSQDARIVLAGGGSGLGYRLAPAIASAAADLVTRSRK